jgi:hypothetical protein
MAAAEPIPSSELPHFFSLRRRDKSPATTQDNESQGSLILAQHRFLLLKKASRSSSPQGG